ncbi:peptidase inhibitor family I36 protein [Streptomyces sp. NPDC058335]|uniref:peptidase inhibitor family I36 protein n=1 Tax=Streptomyces sp. NPDC058335 TaxID=3346451 RepID=UPI003669B2D8
MIHPPKAGVIVKFKRIGAMAIAALALIGGSSLTTATPAVAAETCPSGKLCLYRSTEYRTLALTSASTSACFELIDYGLTNPWNGINSYVNNLPVKATLWNWIGEYPYIQSASIRAGGSSSDTYGTGEDSEIWGFSEYVCTGSATPN